ncbi:endothelin-converting enzyme-like 1 [Haemaphysalis longicornis]
MLPKREWTGLQHQNLKRVVLGIAAVVGLLGVLLLLASLQLSGRGFTGSVCWKLRCFEYAQLLNETLNASVDPCQSFTQLVCHGWHRRHQLRLSEMVVQRAIAEVTEDSTNLRKENQLVM